MRANMWIHRSSLRNAIVAQRLLALNPVSSASPTCSRPGKLIQSTGFSHSVPQEPSIGCELLTFFLNMPYKSLVSLKFNLQSSYKMGPFLQSMCLSSLPGRESRRKQGENEEVVLKPKVGEDDSKEKPSINSLGDSDAAADDAGSSQDVEQIFNKMKETGLIPNAVAMLDGLCKDGLVQEAMKLFGEMREKGTIPEVVIYTAVVEGFCRAWKLDDAKRIFNKMQANGVVPNAFSYAVLIQGLTKDRKLEDAGQFVIEMLDKGWRPNVATYVLLVDAFCKEQKLEEARRIISQLREKGFVADERSVRDYMDKKGPFFPSVWEVMFGKKPGRSAA